MKCDKAPPSRTASGIQWKHWSAQEAPASTTRTFSPGTATQHFITAAQPPCLPATCFLPAVFPHIESSNPRSLLHAPHFQNASSWSIDHKELSYPAWTLCISKRRRIHLLSFPLLKVLYSLYPPNFCVTVSFVREDRRSLVCRN